MAIPSHSVTLTAEQVEQLNRQLADFRHNVNNHLSLMVAAVELMRRKPELTAQFMESLVQPAQKIGAELKSFSDELQRTLQGNRS